MALVPSSPWTPQQERWYPIREIPFKGDGESLNNVAGGFVDMVFSGYELRSFRRSQKDRYFAHTGREPWEQRRSRRLPRPSGIRISELAGAHRPEGTPKAVTDKLNGALTEIFAEKRSRTDLLARNRWQSQARRPKQRITSKEIATNKTIIEGIGLKPE